MASAPASTTGGPLSSSSSGLPPPPPPPKILLAKPGLGPAATEDDPSPALLRSRNAPQPCSLNLLSVSWDLHTDRILPFLTDNSDFTVVGIIGPPGVGKSTIMNELYGFDGSSPGMLPPFATQSDETRAMVKHCTMGVELRVSAERIILLDAQPVFSSSILAEMMRPDGSSSVPVLNGESLSADLAHELMGIQLGVFLASICNILLVVSEGNHDFSMWNLMLTVDLLKHRIPDPSSLTSSHSLGFNPGIERANKSNTLTTNEEHLASPVFIHTKLQGREVSPSSVTFLRKALSQYLDSSSFSTNSQRNLMEMQINPTNDLVDWRCNSDVESSELDLYVVPLKMQGDVTRPNKAQFGSYTSMIGKLRDQVLSMNGRPFTKLVSERDWLRNSAKIWDLVKRSPAVADYCKELQSSGLFRSQLQHGVDSTPPNEKRRERRRSGSADKWSSLR